MRALIVAAAMASVTLSSQAALAQGESRRPLDARPAPDVPEKYPLDYPPAERFCPPVRSFFFEVVRTVEFIRGRRVTHEPNGGYGLPARHTVDGKRPVHAGADVGWFRVGEPVYAVAAGVVRASDGPDSIAAGWESDPGDLPGGGIASQRPKMRWGNVVTIEHRLPDGEYFTTIYGHLGNDRLVVAGDLVEAGQPIGTIGKKDARINGGFDPHLHFAVRQGRLAEPGCTLMVLQVGGRTHSLKLVAVEEDDIEVELPAEFSGSYVLWNGRIYPLARRRDACFLPARLLWAIKLRPGFEIFGYGLSLEGWHDPVAFLRQHGADRNPAPFRGPEPGRAARKR